MLLPNGVKDKSKNCLKIQQGAFYFYLSQKRYNHLQFIYLIFVLQFNTQLHYDLLTTIEFHHCISEEGKNYSSNNIQIPE